MGASVRENFLARGGQAADGFCYLFFAFGNHRDVINMQILLFSQGGVRSSDFVIRNENNKKDSNELLLKKILEFVFSSGKNRKTVFSMNFEN